MKTRTWDANCVNLVSWGRRRLKAGRRRYRILTLWGASARRLPTGTLGVGRRDRPTEAGGEARRSETRRARNRAAAGFSKRLPPVVERLLPRAEATVVVFEPLDVVLGAVALVADGCVDRAEAKPSKGPRLSFVQQRITMRSPMTKPMALAPASKTPPRLVSSLRVLPITS